MVKNSIQESVVEDQIHLQFSNSNYHQAQSQWHCFQQAISSVLEIDLIDLNLLISYFVFIFLYLFFISTSYQFIKFPSQTSNLLSLFSIVIVFFLTLSIVSAVAIIVYILIAGFVSFRFGRYLAGYCSLCRNYDYYCHCYCFVDFLLLKMPLYCQKFINIYINRLCIIIIFLSFNCQNMSSSEQEHSQQNNFLPQYQNNLLAQYQNLSGQYFLVNQNDDRNQNINFLGRPSDMDLIQKNKEKNGLMTLPLFSNIIWMNDCQSEREKKLYPVLKLNFQVIYGKQFLCFQTKQQVLEYIHTNQVDQINIQIQEEGKLIQINAPIFLILCNNNLLPFFQTNLSTKKQVYKKCILFRDNAQNTNNNVYGSIKQAYDIIEVVQKLTKYLFEQNYKNARTMYKQFNVYLKNQDQIYDNYDYDQQDMRVIYKSGQMYEGELSPTFTMIQQQQIKNLPIFQDQLMQQQQIQSGQLDKIIQKYFVSNALNKIIGTDLECRFDPSAVSLIIMTSSSEWRQYQSGEILIRNNNEIKQLLQNEQKPKLIILTSQIQKQEEIISQNQQTYIWIKCKFPIQTLSQEQITIYKTKYANKNLSSSSTKIKIVTSIDQMEKVLRQAQDILENSMF